MGNAIGGFIAEIPMSSQPPNELSRDIVDVVRNLVELVIGRRTRG